MGPESVSLSNNPRLPRRPASEEGAAEPFSIQAGAMLRSSLFTHRSQTAAHIWLLSILDTQQHSLNHTCSKINRFLCTLKRLPGDVSGDGGGLTLLSAGLSVY